MMMMMMMKRRIPMEEKREIKVETHSNRDFRTYHTNFQISNSHLEIFYRPLRESSNEYLKKVGRKGSTLIQRVMEIPGITGIFSAPYSVGVEKGQNFIWEEIEPQILETVEKS